MKVTEVPPQPPTEPPRCFSVELTGPERQALRREYEVIGKRFDYSHGRVLPFISQLLTDIAFP